MQYNSTKNRLQIMHWNCQGITEYSKAIELQLFLKEHSIDLLMLNETFLKPQHKLVLPGYKIYRNDRETHGGGVAIAVRTSIIHRLQKPFLTKTFENICVSIKIGNKEVLFIAAYCPRYARDFTSDLELLTSAEDYFLLGDFNAKHSSWNCWESNTAGRELYNHQFSSNYYIYYPYEPTRIPQNECFRRSSTIDLLISNSTLNFTDVETHPFKLTSDHIPISFCINEHIEECEKFFYDFSNANWQQFKSALDSKLYLSSLVNEELSSTTIENILNFITDTLSEVCYETIPRRCRKQHNLQLSDFCKSLISTRNRYRRKSQRCSDTALRITYKAITKELNKLISFHVNNARNQQWSKFLSNMPVGSKQFWKITKYIKGKKKQFSDLNVNNSVITDGAEKANIIADYFLKAHLTSVNLSSTVDNKVESFNDSLERLSTGEESVLPTNVTELKYYLSALKNSKSPGLDGIQNVVLKNLPLSVLSLLVKVFNFCISNSYFPKCFKKAKVIPIPKNGKNPKIPSSYRPISLLSSLDKIFERIVFARLKMFVDNNNLLHKCQYGFREQHSTLHQLKRVVNIIKMNKRKRHSTGILFLDIEKAFDSIWHKGLVYKLYKMQCPNYLVKLVQSFLSGRSFVVDVDGHKSNEILIPAGVPQGSVLSPLLYSLYISDFKVLSGNDVAFYADDSAFISHGKVSNAIVKRMQNVLISAEKYFHKWKIKVNEEKSQAILFPFNKSPKRTPTRVLTVQGHIIPFSHSIKYLGLTLDQKLTFKEHIENSCIKAIKCGRALFPLLNRRSRLNLKNKLLLYKMCIRPIFLYACQIWSKCAKTHKKRLQIIQNKNLKIIFNLPNRYSTVNLHNLSNQKTIETLIDDLTLSFNEKCRMSTHAHLRDLASSD